MFNNESIGKNIRKERKSKGLSQKDLAERCGFAVTSLSVYENGKGAPSIYTIANIAEKLGVTVDQLLYGDESSAFINSAPDVGRKIVNAVYFLWERNIICFSLTGYNQYNPKLGELYDNDGKAVYLLEYLFPILRLLQGLNDFDNKRDTYSDPDAYIEMLLSSVANEINGEIERKEKIESEKKELLKDL